MNAFLSDIWHDLREKRLWPVALALLIGVVAVPVLLSKPAPETSSAPVTQPATAAGKDTTPVVELADLTKIEKSSKLQEFDPKNPFKPKVKPVKLSSVTQTALNNIAANTPATTGGGTTGGGTTGGGTTGGGTVTPTEPTQKVARYTYVIDVTFTSNGRRRVIKGLDRLSMLPSQTNPALLFLGVSSDGSDAVFLVDSTLDAAGEGNCSPSPNQCATLALGAGSEHDFTDQKGNSYTLRVDEIRKVKVGKAKAAAAKRAKQAHASVAATAAKATAPIKPFVMPILADLVTVANTVTARSSNAKTGR